MRRLRPPTPIDERPSRKKIFTYLGLILTFCYLTQFGFNFPPKSKRIGEGIFDHERPQVVQDMMDQEKKKKYEVVEKEE